MHSLPSGSDARGPQVLINQSNKIKAGPTRLTDPAWANGYLSSGLAEAQLIARLSHSPGQFLVGHDISPFADLSAISSSSKRLTHARLANRAHAIFECGLTGACARGQA